MMKRKEAPELPPGHPRRLAAATGAAAGLALVVLFVAILPAEYGVDPLGTGRLLGLDRLSGSGTEARELDPDAGADVVQEVSARYLEERVLILQQSAYHPRSDTEKRVDFRIDAPNVTQVHARLEWLDDDRLEGQATLPDLFELTLHGPGDRRSRHVQAENGPDGAGAINASISWISPPRPETNGTRWTFDAEEDRSAVGSWQAVVRLYEARGLANRSQPEDPGNGWTLTVTALTYRLDLTSLSEVEAWDRVDFLLPRGGRLEYKFAMEANATLDYAWTASASLFYDLHGDRGEQDESPVSHRQGRADHDEGHLVVPFAGRHGWYWQNLEHGDVQLTLRTRGEYGIIGVV